MVSADFDDVGVSFDSWSSSVGVEFSTSVSISDWCCNLSLVGTRCRIIGAWSGVNAATRHNEVVIIISIKIVSPTVRCGNIRRFFDSGATVIFEALRRTQCVILSLLRNVDLMMVRRSAYFIYRRCVMLLDQLRTVCDVCIRCDVLCFVMCGEK